MTNQTKAAAAVLAAINNNTLESLESTIGLAIKTAARALLETTTDKEKLVLHRFIALALELQGHPVSDVSREALAEDCPGLELSEEPQQLAAAIEPTPSAPALPPALVYDAGDGVQIDRPHKFSDWAIWRFNASNQIEYLCYGGQWEIEPSRYPSRDYFLWRDKCRRWPSAEAACAALRRYRAAEGAQP